MTKDKGGFKVIEQLRQFYHSTTDELVVHYNPKQEELYIKASSELWKQAEKLKHHSPGRKGTLVQSELTLDSYNILTIQCTMPRRARLDAPGTLHHVIGRGISGTKAFGTKRDKEDFLGRLAERCVEGSLAVYAWTLMDTHFHILVQTGDIPLSSSMRKLLTGYVVNFNRRHKRYGHLFQNRFKSIVCEQDPYLLELCRYIHLNPLRAGIVVSGHARALNSSHVHALTYGLKADLAS